MSGAGTDRIAALIARGRRASVRDMEREVFGVSVIPDAEVAELRGRVGGMLRQEAGQALRRGVRLHDALLETPVDEGDRRMDSDNAFSGKVLREWRLAIKMLAMAEAIDGKGK